MSGAGLEVDRLSLDLDDFALEEIDLAVAPGEILVVLGPNGTGKSVMLETIAGFHRPRRGRILINGRDVTFLPPERRRVGLLFQNYALFPHLTVAENVALPLRAGRRGAAARGAAADLLERFGAAHLAGRGPSLLSPGEKQRVALARALAAEPEVYLFDEPFSALDARTRETMRDDLRSFLRRARVPAVFVTHDHVEAGALADRIAILRDGAIVQSGARAEVYDAPADAFVAEFTGIENLLAGRVVEGPDGSVAVGKHVLRARRPATARPPMAAVLLCIRAEDVALRRSDVDARPDPAINRIAGRVRSVTESGALTRVMLDCGFPLRAALAKREARALGLAPDRPVAVEIESAAISLVAAPSEGSPAASVPSGVVAC